MWVHLPFRNLRQRVPLMQWWEAACAIDQNVSIMFLKMYLGNGCYLVNHTELSLLVLGPLGCHPPPYTWTSPGLIRCCHCEIFGHTFLCTQNMINFKSLVFHGFAILSVTTMPTTTMLPTPVLLSGSWFWRETWIPVPVNS